MESVSFKDLVSCTEAARMKNCSRQYMTQLLKSGRVNGTKVGGQHMVKIDETFNALKVHSGTGKKSIVERVKVLEDVSRKTAEDGRVTNLENIIDLQGKEISQLKGEVLAANQKAQVLSGFMEQLLPGEVKQLKDVGRWPF